MNHLSNPPGPEPEQMPSTGAGWSMLCRVRPKSLVLRLTDQNSGLMLIAKLPALIHDPQALAVLFETLARYSGRRLTAVIAAADRSVPTFESVFIDQSRQMGSSRWVNLQFDVPANGMAPSPFSTDNQLALDFDAVEF